MLSKTRCPHTGIVNFFYKAEPLMAVGSVTEMERSTLYAWRCYIEDRTGGVSLDPAIAEAELRSAIADGAGRVDHVSR